MTHYFSTAKPVTSTAEEIVYLTKGGSYSVRDVGIIATLIVTASYAIEIFLSKCLFFEVTVLNVSRSGVLVFAWSVHNSALVWVISLRKFS